jgi:hypothetical protein
MKNYKKAQQLVEFVVVLPIIVVIFMFIIEIGFTLNAKIALAEAVRMSLTKVNQLADKTGTEIEDSIKSSVITYLASHGLPNSNLVFVNVFQPTGNYQETAVVKVTYNYKSIFNLLNFSGQLIVPNNFDFTSYQVVNASLFKSNALFLPFLTFLLLLLIHP